MTMDGPMIGPAPKIGRDKAVSNGKTGLVRPLLCGPDDLFIRAWTVFFGTATAAPCNRRRLKV